MRIDLHYTKVGIASGMGSDGPKRTSMFSRQGDNKMPGTDRRGDKRLNCIHRLLIDFTVERERASCSNAAPLSIGLTPKRFVV
jgi:hypothetical protein